MSGLREHTGTIAVIEEDHVDTDRIIPARFLSMVTKTGYGELLFKDVRGPDFPLDQPSAQGATILVVGTNFGCGSSREHAVWAIQQGGFVAVIARRTPETLGFSDIFRQNAANCGLLLIELDAEDHRGIVRAGQGASVYIDVEAQTVSVENDVYRFELAPATKDQILKGLDLIGTTMTFESQIEQYEATRLRNLPASGVTSPGL